MNEYLLLLLLCLPAVYALKLYKNHIPLVARSTFTFFPFLGLSGGLGKNTVRFNRNTPCDCCTKDTERDGIKQGRQLHKALESSC